METIRNYLESMFAALPDTEGVRRAKQELGAMMEDKYSELCGEGRSENEAIGIVIAEFGNLDEVSEALGLEEIMRGQEVDHRESLTLEQANAFLREKAHGALLIGLGVFLCIISPVGCIISGYAESDAAIAVGLATLFGCISIAVGLFVYAGLMEKRYKSLERGQYRVDYGIAASISEQYESQQPNLTLMTVLGVVLCIVSVLPVSVLGTLASDDGFMVYIGTVLLFVIVAIGVWLLVISGIRKEAYTRLLNLNRRGTMGARHADEMVEDGYRYENAVTAKIMSVYWPTITCVYLIISFLTFDWGRTWLIWPVAALIHTVVKRLLGTKVVEE